MRSFSHIWILVFVLLCNTSLNSQCLFELKDSRHVQLNKVVFVREGEPFTIISMNHDTIPRAWFTVRPILKEYRNTATGMPYANKDIAYIIQFHSINDTLFLTNDECGTYYYVNLAFHPNQAAIPSMIFTTGLLVDELTGSFQIVVRKDDSYLGYLTELLNTPFILTPRFSLNKKHQTDLRIGSDCAEMAIYGKRREGHQYKYLGPRGIYKYLNEISKDSLFEGCILHFRDQVSVLYKDNHTKGKLDPDDLLIQSYGDYCKIVTYRDSGFFHHPYRAYIWKDYLVNNLASTIQRNLME